MNRLTLERHQVWIYLTAIIGGLLMGSGWPGVNHTFEILLWPTLMLLLYTTFVQVPLLHLREAFADHRFVAVVLTGNFIVLPVLAGCSCKGYPRVPLCGWVCCWCYWRPAPTGSSRSLNWVAAMCPALSP